MRRIALAIAAAFLPAGFAGGSPALAEVPLQASRMSCLDIERQIDRDGARIIAFGGGTYERIVSHSGQCLAGQITQPFIARTASPGACLVGYVCTQIESKGD
jgi:hypothetical protein